jgi:hypothetical protein
VNDTAGRVVLRGQETVEEMEVCSGRARIDLAVIGERLIGFEIKGPQDSVARLRGQAKAYSQCLTTLCSSFTSPSQPESARRTGLVGTHRGAIGRWPHPLLIGLGCSVLTRQRPN